jgi:ectoine hydroxylase-related dioxygenase (phytanoyl-CoA dioxygenase family)
MAGSLPVITDEQRHDFRVRGVIHVHAVLAKPQLAILRRAFDWTISHPGRLAKGVVPGTPGTLYGDLANADAFPAYRQVNQQTVIPRLVSAVWGKPDVWYMYEQIFLKTGGTDKPAARTPWHQDESYLPVTGSDLAVVWVSFEALSAAESLEFVVGSHRGTLHDGSRFDPADDTLPLYGTGELPRLPDIEADRAAYEIVSFAVEPGDVVIFHPAMLHGGAPIGPDKHRSTLSLRYFGEDARVALRPGDTAATLARIAARDQGVHPMQKAKLLGEGAPFRHPGFPKVAP